jgi:hypothetical protein
VFLNAIPGASLVAMRRGLRTAGVTSAQVIGYTEPRANSQSLFLTPNTETTYGTTVLDLRAWGPTVIEAPPQSLCVVDDFWFRYVAVHANDFSFYEEVDELVQEEPVEALDPERAGQLASIGIVKGQPFAPDRRVREILERAAQIGAGMARVIAYAPRDPEASLYGSWKNAFVGGSYEFLRNGARLLDARTQFHYIATVITPAMAHAQVGAGSAYAYTVHDANGDLLDGSKTYRLHVDPDPPAKNFSAVDVDDTQTRSLLQVPSTIWPALASNSGALHANDDGSYDLYFGPKAPEGKESNWVETIPGKAWFQLFRLYGPLQPWFDQTWKLNEFEPID